MILANVPQPCFEVRPTPGLGTMPKPRSTNGAPLVNAIHQRLLSSARLCESGLNP